MKPKIIFDIGFLGHAQDDPSAQRGAQRVARHWFDGLVASDECELSYVATTHLAGAYDFLKANDIEPEAKLHLRPGRLASSRCNRRLTRAVHRTLADRRLPARARRGLLARLAGLFPAGDLAFSPAWLARADIYHSPHTPFPQVVHQNRRLRKFLSCMDFIPLKNPEYFSAKARPFMEAVLACLKPENFAFCISETTRADVLNFSKMPPEHVFVTPLAADPEIFHPIVQADALRAARATFGLGEKPYFLALSAHDPHKNFVHLIECFGALVEAGELPDINLVIVGPNPGRNPAAQNAIAKFPRARSRIIVPGFVPDAELAAIYSGALAFLFPSLAEGFGIPPLEAMQCGVPVIASNATSIPEVVGEAGMLLPPTDVDAWCQAMLKISRDATLRQELIKRSLARAKLFSWQRFMDETLRGYRASLEM